jgi:hypothetical protein
VELTAIGHFEEGEPDVFLHDEKGRQLLPPGGHDHFRARSS